MLRISQINLDTVPCLWALSTDIPLSQQNRLALNLLKREKTIKASIRGKRFIVGWDKSYLLRLIFT